MAAIASEYSQSEPETDNDYEDDSATDYDSGITTQDEGESTAVSNNNSDSDDVDVDVDDDNDNESHLGSQSQSEEELPCSSSSLKSNSEGSKKLKLGCGTEKATKKWESLEHKGPVFAPDYIPLPDDVKFSYKNKPMKLSKAAEEVACHYANMLGHNYLEKKTFNDNFFKDWRNVMTSVEQKKITKLGECNFNEINQYFNNKRQQKKEWTKEQKKEAKAEKQKIDEEFGFCIVNGVKEKIGNFRIEPPGLFRGRGDHPKMGTVKHRINPEDVTINCSKDKIPEPPTGHEWKEVLHDKTGTWLARWKENINGSLKYIWLSPSSSIKRNKDRFKYEIARELGSNITRVRNDYMAKMKSRSLEDRQIGVAVYLIDKLALRAGHEKDEDKSADTVGCCSLRCEHITFPEEEKIELDFLGKDSMRYHNKVSVTKLVFDLLKSFKNGKKQDAPLFDAISTQKVNNYLKSLMPGLTAKVFRTYNASSTLQQELNLVTPANANISAYNEANRKVAVLCNHQKSIPKNHENTMKNIQEKIDKKSNEIDDAKKALKKLKKKSTAYQKKKDEIASMQKNLDSLESKKKEKENGKSIALGTSKLNYLDPRISIAWCKKHGIPIKKVFNKTQQEKFQWAIDEATADFKF